MAGISHTRAATSASPGGTATRAEEIRSLLQALSRVSGLSACLHDLYNLAGIEKPWLEHWNDACMDIKRENQPRCARFCGGKVHRDVGTARQGSIHTCPFGFTDISVPVLVEGRPVFILFLGTCWTGGGRPPHPKLPVVRARSWLEDRLELARATACRLAEVMRTGNGPPDTRREAVLTFLHGKIDSPVRLPDVARVLGLSESRSGHVIRELFGLTLPQLIATVKLFEAARLLSLTDHTVADIATGLGYCDQSHFSNAFRKRYRMSPLAYRRRHKSTV